jgi:hypothetical protein
MKKPPQPQQACCQKVAHRRKRTCSTDLQRNPSFNSTGGDPSGSGRISVGMRTCEKIPPRLRAPLNVPGRVAGPPISGHVELATLPDIGTPAPCQTRPGAPSLRAGIISQALRAEIGLKGRSSRERFRRGRWNSARFCVDHGEKFAAIRAKIEANGCSIPVDFSKKGFYFSYTRQRMGPRPEDCASPCGVSSSTTAYADARSLDFRR